MQFLGFFKYSESQNCLGRFSVRDHDFYLVNPLILTEPPGEVDNDGAVHPNVKGIPFLDLMIDRNLEVSVTTIKTPIFICHKSYFIDGYVTFREGMKDIYGIKNIVADESFLPADERLFPPSKEFISGGINSESDLIMVAEYEKVKLRNFVANLFIKSLIESRGKKCLNFSFNCNYANFSYLIGQDVIEFYSTVGSSSEHYRMDNIHKDSLVVHIPSPAML